MIRETNVQDNPTETKEERKRDTSSLFQGKQQFQNIIKKANEIRKHGKTQKHVDHRRVADKHKSTCARKRKQDIERTERERAGKKWRWNRRRCVLRGSVSVFVKRSWNVDVGVTSECSSLHPFWAPVAFPCSFVNGLQCDVHDSPVSFISSAFVSSFTAIPIFIGAAVSTAFFCLLVGAADTLSMMMMISTATRRSSQVSVVPRSLKFNSLKHQLLDCEDLLPNLFSVCLLDERPLDVVEMLRVFGSISFSDVAD